MHEAPQRRQRMCTDMAHTDIHVHTVLHFSLFKFFHTHIAYDVHVHVHRSFCSYLPTDKPAYQQNLHMRIRAYTHAIACTCTSAIIWLLNLGYVPVGKPVQYIVIARLQPLGVAMGMRMQSSIDHTAHVWCLAQTVSWFRLFFARCPFIHWRPTLARGVVHNASWCTFVSHPAAP